MTGPHFIRSGSVAAAVLERLSTGECVGRQAVIAAVLPQAKTSKYADEVMESLRQRGFIRSSLVQITDEGRAALARIASKEADHG